MSATDTAAVVRRYVEGMNKGNYAVADEVVAPDFVMHPLWYQPTVSAAATVRGPELAKQTEAGMRRAFPDLQTTIDEVIEAGDRVIIRFTRRGTHTGGRHVTDQGISIFRLADGKIVESWTARDRLGQWQQLAVVPETRELMAKVGSSSLQVSSAQPGQ